jgi:YhcH/YjgK/YiaL family protein
MPYIINTINLSLADIFKSTGLVSFVGESIEQARKLEVGEFNKQVLDDEVFCISQNIALKPSSKGVFESHKEYIDVHIVVEGHERVEIMPVSEMPEPYDRNIDNDYYLYKIDKCDREVLLSKDKIAVFQFNDAHKVGLETDAGKGNIIKVVLKIKENTFKKEYIYV